MFVFKTAVVGAGTTGAEIAYAIADAEVPVVLKDVDPGAVESAIANARSIWQARVDAGKLDAHTLERRVELIAGTVEYDGLGDVDLVIEAVPDRIELKQAVFSELDQVTPGHAILASSTSALPITEIAEATTRVDKVLGMHFFHPASVTRAVEMVEGEYTSAETLHAAFTFAQAIRKIPIRSADAPGFIVNRILGASGSPPDGAGEMTERSVLGALVESCLVLEEGVGSMREIDIGLMAGAGVTPPPLRRADQAGLDVQLAALEGAQQDWGESFEPPTILRRLVAQGRLGVKSGQGFYPYPRADPGWEEQPVALERRGAVAIAWLQRPPANSISPEVAEVLSRLWDEVSSDSRVRALIFASANPMLFSAGADIKAFTTMDAAAGAELLRTMHTFLRAMEQSSIVTIAAVNAGAFGGGCELALGCDFRIAGESATFGQPEINLGIVPGFGGTQRLPRLVGTSKALEMNLTGEPISAQEAYELGLVNRVMPDHELFDAALAWARKLAGQAPLAIEQIKRVSGAGDLDAGIEAEQESFLTAFASEDAKEGIAAFLQKRAPRFRGSRDEPEVPRPTPSQR
jgi:enoyl-CoA hydratase/3-hydroxyacyl-CoA dehydrogenase